MNRETRMRVIIRDMYNRGETINDMKIEIKLFKFIYQISFQRYTYKMQYISDPNNRNGLIFKKIDKERLDYLLSEHPRFYIGK